MRNPLKRFVSAICLAAIPASGAAYGAILGIAAAGSATNKTSAAFYDNQIAMLNAMSHAAYFTLWACGLVGAWAFAVFWSWEWRIEYESLGKLIDQPTPSSQIHAAKPNVTLQPDSATHVHTATKVQPLRLEGLYVGWMVVSAGKLNSDQYLEIALRGYNGTGHSLRRAALNGHIMWNDAPLPTPASMDANLDEIIPDGTEFVVVFHQHVTLDNARQILVAFEASSGTILGLNSLNVMVQSVGDANLTARLPLWDGLHLRRRDDLFTGRVIAASANVAIKSGVSMSMTVTRTDGSTEERNA